MVELNSLLSIGKPIRLVSVINPGLRQWPDKVHVNTAFKLCAARGSNA